MSWWRRLIWVCKILLPVNLLLAGAALACLEYPVFRLREIDLVFADGRAVSPELYQQTTAILPVTADSNLFAIDEQALARSILLWNADLSRVEVRLVPPHKLVIRLHAAQPTLWWSADRVLCLAGDGHPLKAEVPDDTGYPICVGQGFGKFERWQLVQFYERLVAHNPLWTEVISQVHYDPSAGWLLILNGGAERILLGHHPDENAFGRVCRFLESVPEEEWACGTIDARFGGRIIVTPPDEKNSADDQAISDTLSENLSVPVGGRSKDGPT